jgi:uncharacterized protein YndB with AHSA1/START domain
MADIKPFLISRVFDAPRDRVWRAWTEVEQLKQWWGPKGFAVTHCKLDLRPGGIMHYCLRMPGGNEMWGKFVYREIVKPERLVWVNSFSDKDGGLTVHPMNPNWPREMLSRAEFEEQGGKTKLSIQWVPLDGSTELECKTFEEGRESMKMGWSGTMEQFTAYLAKA